MADQIEINIYLKSDEQGPKSADGVVGSSDNIPISKPEKETIKQNQALASLGKYVASQTVSVFIGNAKSSISQNIGLITGKSELQQRVNFGMGIAQETVNTVKNASAGATIASTLGVAGWVGAVVGVALSAISYGMNLNFKNRQLEIQEGLENRQINQTLSRYGAGYNKSRSGL